MNDERILQAMRQQAWARAKAELQSVLVTFYNGEDVEGKKKFRALDALVEDFIKTVEGDGLAE